VDAERLKCSEITIFVEVAIVVVKIIELIGSSPKGWKEATQNAVDEAAKTVRNIKSVHLKRCTAKVAKNKIVEYRALVRVAFTVEIKK
jgi:flavin-binding protein dodecin